jgi:hypothetical protein
VNYARRNWKIMRKKKKEKKKINWGSFAKRQIPTDNEGYCGSPTLDPKDRRGGINQAPEPINRKYEFIHVVSGGMAPIPETITRQEITAEKEDLIEWLDYQADMEENPEDYD